MLGKGSILFYPTKFVFFGFVGQGWFVLSFLVRYTGWFGRMCLPAWTFETFSFMQLPVAGLLFRQPELVLPRPAFLQRPVACRQANILFTRDIKENSPLAIPRSLLGGGPWDYL